MINPTILLYLQKPFFELTGFLLPKSTGQPQKREKAPFLKLQKGEKDDFFAKERQFQLKNPEI